MKQPLIMKQNYLKPQVDIMEFNLEGPLCMSGIDGNGSIVQDVTIDDEFNW